MNTCPCCSDQMLRHVGQQRVYWFCRSCWQEMPLLDREPGLNASALFARQLAASVGRSMVKI